MNIKNIIHQIKCCISYIAPIRSPHKSEYSKCVYVTFQNGKKILQSIHADYSFSSLHRIMRFALSKVVIGKDDHILLLGLGGGSVIELVRNELKKENHITAVEIDPVIIDIAKKEFDLDSYSHTQIICDDAYVFVQNEAKKYELIIVDLWIDNRVPDQFYDTLFWENILRLFSEKGQIIFNLYMQTTEKRDLDEVIFFLEENNFEVSKYDKVDKTNFVIIARKN